ncbi:MAG TPA: TGS domain-containing protein, partial [Pyrinomonadaceae bacterium]|nr:TGS domain-containing protein [Pyrinomonadaceae bacterium]
MSELNVKYGENQRFIPAPATAADALKALDRDVLKRSLAAKVNGEEVDLNKELSGNGEVISIEPITADTRDGLEVIRHSTAHLLAAAVLELFPGTKLGIGPALMEDPRYGFFYDVIAPRNLTEEDLPVIEKKMKAMAKQNLVYRREDIEKAKILDIFEQREEPLKRELIDEKVSDTASVYYIDNSSFIDFCLGPHVPHTGKLQA